VQTDSGRGKAMTNEQMLSDPKFWELYFFAFCDEQKVKEFSQACSIPEDLIRTKRREWLHNYLREQSPYWHRNPGTIQ
jgi:hypothetical protein